jgi:hypothetical protein
LRVPLADPWYDYLALLIALLVLPVQAASLFSRRRAVRWTVSLACTVAVAVALIYVASLPIDESEGVNIGAGVLLLLFLCSLVLLVVLVVRDLVWLVVGRVRS